MPAIIKVAPRRAQAGSAPPRTSRSRSRSRSRAGASLALCAALSALAIPAASPHAPAGASKSIGSVHRSGSAPLTVETIPHETLAVAEVSINGHGPYPFIVDTGSSRSVVSTAVARDAGLKIAATTVPVAGVGCQTTAHESTVSTWKVGGVRLPADTVDVLPLAIRTGNARCSGSGTGTSGTSGPSGTGAKTRVGGLLGSDVLSRFGVVALDYEKAMLRLGAAAVSLSTKSAKTVPIHVVSTKKAVLALAPVRIDGHGPYTFVIDTGAGSSVVASSIAHKLTLRVLSKGKATGVASTVATRSVQISGWRVSSVSLPGTTLTSTSLTAVGGGNTDIAGLLGSNTLSRFGTIAVNYAHQKLLLKAR